MAAAPGGAPPTAMEVDVAAAASRIAAPETPASAPPAAAAAAPSQAPQSSPTSPPHASRPPTKAAGAAWPPALRTPPSTRPDEIAAPTASAARRRSKTAAAGLKLVTGAVSVPLATKRTAGEDAFFVTPCGRGVGVADGVGGWSNLGVDAGLYSRRPCSGTSTRWRRT